MRTKARQGPPPEPHAHKPSTHKIHCAGNNVPNQKLGIYDCEKNIHTRQKQFLRGRTLTCNHWCCDYEAQHMFTYTGIFHRVVQTNACGYTFVIVLV